MTEIRKIYAEDLRIHVVEEIESGRMSRVEASREYGVPKCLIKSWLEEYGKFKPKRDIVEVVMKSEKDRIAELEKALADAHLKNRLYEEIINLAEEEYNLDLKKSFGTEQCGNSSQKASKSKRSAKRSK